MKKYNVLINVGYQRLQNLSSFLIIDYYRWY